MPDESNSDLSATQFQKEIENLKAEFRDQLKNIAVPPRGAQSNFATEFFSSGTFFYLAWTSITHRSLSGAVQAESISCLALKKVLTCA
jgi:hypothetical protein